MTRLDGLLPLNGGSLRGQFWVPEPGVWTNGFDLTSALAPRVPIGGRIRIPDPLRPRPIGLASTDYIYDQTGSVGLSATVALGAAARRTTRFRLAWLANGNVGTFGGGRAALYRRREYIAD
ncbi:hypothetical protein [Rhodovulum kholense]|uniref:Uncharacterized protein n=1 Tax=Rhodovulum kholense TaxID=453584 RepID=A0A8E3ASN8_9RHOB|nr:hypothetical protein [Rhodovulum kholense]PTW51920.1 hypothetical protein C8N38_101224 [Rhodovulum kholense]